MAARATDQQIFSEVHEAVMKEYPRMKAGDLNAVVAGRLARATLKAQEETDHTLGLLRVERDLRERLENRVVAYEELLDGIKNERQRLRDRISELSRAGSKSTLLAAIRGLCGAVRSDEAALLRGVSRSDRIDAVVEKARANVFFSTRERYLAGWILNMEDRVRRVIGDLEDALP